MIRFAVILFNIFQSYPYIARTCGGVCRGKAARSVNIVGIYPFDDVSFMCDTDHILH